MTHHFKSMTHHQLTRRWLCEIGLFSLRREKKRKKCYSLTKIMVILKDSYEDSKMDFSTNQNIRILFKIIISFIENFNLKFRKNFSIFKKIRLTHFCRLEVIKRPLEAEECHILGYLRIFVCPTFFGFLKNRVFGNSD